MSVVDSNRRLLLKALLASPLYTFAPSLQAVTQGDIDAFSADRYWQRYLQGRFPVNNTMVIRHENRQCEQALQEIAAPIMAMSTRKHLDWRMGLLHAGPPNAFTPGGGVIFVLDSLIAFCDTEAELASVIAHEVGHVEHRHAIRRIYSQGILAEMGIDTNWDTQKVISAFKDRQYELVSQKLAYKSYQRLWEHQADAYIVRVFRHLGYPMVNAYSFFEKLLQVYADSSPGLCIFGSHPQVKERIQRIKGLGRAYGKQARKGDSEAFKYLKATLN